MPLIQNPTIARKLQRLLRLTGLPDSILAPEIVGVILVEDASAPLSDIERGCMGAEAVIGVAAEVSLLALVRVGAPAPYDLVVTEVFFSSPTAQIVDVAVPTAGLSGLSVSGNTTFTDLELPGRPSSQFAFNTQVGIPANRILYSVPVLANEVMRIPVKIRVGTIGQGADLTSLMIVGRTVNTTIRGGFSWTESSPQG